MSTATKTRKHRQVIRTIRLNVAPFEGNPGVVTIRVGKVVRDYLVRQLPADSGRGFKVEKLAPDEDGPESYDVNLAPDGHHSCECMGFLRWGHCKHVNGLQALVSRGKL